MNSTCSSSQPLIEIKDLSLPFKLQLTRGPTTFRSKFVNAFRPSVNRLKGHFYAIKNVNLKIFHGERVGIIGGNGSGKTSLCRCLASMYLPQAGSIKYNGKVRAIFDSSLDFASDLSGRENLQLFSRMIYSDLSFAERKKLADEVIEFSELSDFIDLPIKNFSRGMLARLFLSLISAKACDILLMDEVFDGADIFFQEKLSQRISNMIKNSGAVVFVSHSMEQIQSVCNRVVVMSCGEVVFDGNVEEGIEFYKNIKSDENEFETSTLKLTIQ